MSYLWEEIHKLKAEQAERARQEQDLLDLTGGRFASTQQERLRWMQQATAPGIDTQELERLVAENRDRPAFGGSEEKARAYYTRQLYQQAASTRQDAGVPRIDPHELDRLVAENKDKPGFGGSEAWVRFHFRRQLEDRARVEARAESEFGFLEPEAAIAAASAPPIETLMRRRDILEEIRGKPRSLVRAPSGLLAHIDPQRLLEDGDGPTPEQQQTFQERGSLFAPEGSPLDRSNSVTATGSLRAEDSVDRIEAVDHMAEFNKLLEEGRAAERARLDEARQPEQDPAILNNWRVETVVNERRLPARTEPEFRAGPPPGQHSITSDQYMSPLERRAAVSREQAQISRRDRNIRRALRDAERQARRTRNPEASMRAFEIAHIADREGIQTSGAADYEVNRRRAAENVARKQQRGMN